MYHWSQQWRVKTSPTPPTTLTRLVARTKPWRNCCDWPAYRPGSPSRAVSCRTERTGSHSAPPGCYSTQTSRGRRPFWADRTEISTVACAPRIDPSGSAYCGHLAHGVRGGWLTSGLSACSAWQSQELPPGRIVTATKTGEYDRL